MALVKPRANTTSHIDAADRLAADGVTVSVLEQVVALFEDSNGYLHAEPRCWGASKIVRVDVAEFPDLPDPPRCECGGWKGAKAALALDEAGWMYAQLDAEIGSECTDLGRWLTVQAQPVRCSDLDELHRRVQEAAAVAINDLRVRVKTRAALEAVAAQAVRIAVSPEEGLSLRHWAQALLLEEYETRRKWLDDRFYGEFSQQLHDSPRVRAVLACRVGYGSAAVLVQASCVEIVERNGYWVGEAFVPELVVAGMACMRGSGGVAVVLDGDAHPDVWRTAARLWNPRSDMSDLRVVVDLARAVHASAPRG